MTKLSPEELHEIRETFEFNDKNSDGRISFDEFVALLADLDGDMSREECQLGFDAIDTNYNGSVSFDEFVAWWTAD